MTGKRVTDHPILGKIEEQERITFTFDENQLQGYKGDTIASALLANGIRSLREHEESGSPRGIYCNIGHCYECRVTVNGNVGVRACLTELKDGMVVNSSKKQPHPLKKKHPDDELPSTYQKAIDKGLLKGVGRDV